MYLLDSQSYPGLSPVFQGLPYDLAVWAALAGSVPAQIYVDNPREPRSALLWAGHRHFLAGDPSNPRFNQELLDLYDGMFFHPQQEPGQTVFQLVADDPGWQPAVDTLLAGQRAFLVIRSYYRFLASQHPPSVSFPFGYRFEPIDAALLARRELKNMADLEEELCSERPSVAEFLEKSFGVCALIRDEIAGFCTSEYNWRDRCEVGINTLLPYQRQGVAAAMASVFLEQALAQGITQIGWHCFARNLPSAATALKAGFEKVCDYPAWIVDLSQG